MIEQRRHHPAFPTRRACWSPAARSSDLARRARLRELANGVVHPDRPDPHAVPHDVVALHVMWGPSPVAVLFGVVDVADPGSLKTVLPFSSTVSWPGSALTKSKVHCCQLSNLIGGVDQSHGGSPRTKPQCSTVVGADRKRR